MADKSDARLTYSEFENAQEELASTCLEVLQTKDNKILEKSMSLIEVRCLQLFKDGKHHKRTETYRTIIDGLLSLLHINSMCKKQLLSCCLLLSCCSVVRWMEFLRSGILSLHAELGILIAEIMACENLVWTSWEHQDILLIASTLMDISLLRHFEEAGHLSTTTIMTPLSVSIFTCLSHTLKSESRTELSQHMGMLLGKIVNRTIAEAWESVRNEDILSILKLLPEANPAFHGIKLLYSVRVSWFSQTRQQFSKSTAKCQEALRCWRNESETNVITKPPHLNRATDDFENIEFIADAYTLARKWNKNADGVKVAIDSAVKTWMEKDRPELVAAAYVAAPNLLRLRVEENVVTHSHVESLPKGLCSDLDVPIDANLAGLLESVPEIAEVYGVTPNLNRHNHYRRLRRAAILHPLLMLRRTNCFCAAGRVILFGLSTPSKRYSEDALEVLSLLLGVVSELPYASSTFRDTMSAFIVQVFLFIVDEGRLSNGIPKRLEKIAIPILANISICTRDDVERNILGLISKVVEANKQNEILLFHLKKVQESLRELQCNPSTGN